MGRIAELLSFTRKKVSGVNSSDVKINPDGGSNITVPHFASPGDDSVPLTTDTVVTTEVQGTGNEAAVGYIDPINTPKSLAGEKRIYSRDANGAEVAELHLKNDGTIIATNAGGTIELKPDGNLNATATVAMTFTAPVFNFIGNVIITGALTISGIFSAFAGALNMTGGLSMTGGDIVADGKSLKTHTHPAGTPPGNTGTPN